MTTKGGHADLIPMADIIVPILRRSARRILFNLKTVVLHHAGATVQFNPHFMAFASHYIFEPIGAPVAEHRPRHHLV